MITITNSYIISSTYKTVKLLYTVPLIVTFVYAAIFMPTNYISAWNPYLVTKIVTLE
jgi:hypothetical protein